MSDLQAMTRRFEIGPFVLAFGALLLLVGLFLDWYGAFNAWAVFEFVDLFLAALAVASVIGAVGLLTPEVEYVDKRVVPKERVRLETEAVTDEVAVDETVRKERIDYEGDDRPTQR